MKVLSLLAAIVLSFPSPPAPQQSAALLQRDPQALAILQKSLSALAGGQPITDVTLTGTARRIAGPDDESGTATYKATPRASRLDVNLSGGMRSEIRAFGANGPAGNWIGPDAAVHQLVQHNLHTDAGWFPLFTLANLSLSATVVLTYIGPETRNGISVIHIQTAQPEPPNILGSAAKMYPRLTQMDIFLDASTLLPVALAFNTHPDNNALQDIPVEFQFSNYTTVGSLSIPFHVQQFLNNSLLLDLQFQSATLNSGLSAANFQVK